MAYEDLEDGFDALVEKGEYEEDKIEKLLEMPERYVPAKECMGKMVTRPMSAFSNRHGKCSKLNFSRGRDFKRENDNPESNEWRELDRYNCLDQDCGKSYERWVDRFDADEEDLARIAGVLHLDTDLILPKKTKKIQELSDSSQS